MGGFFFPAFSVQIEVVAFQTVEMGSIIKVSLPLTEHLTSDANSAVFTTSAVAVTTALHLNGICDGGYVH